MDSTTRPMCRRCGQKVITEVEPVRYDGDGEPWHEFCWELSEEEGAAEAAYLRDLEEDNAISD